VKDSSIIPKTILGAAWSVQKERMDSGIFFPLFLVLKGKTNTNVYYLPADLQIKEMFIMRNPLSSTARRAGWQGFFYDTTKIPKESFLRLL
jgi:type II restriction enzyme